MRAAIAVPALLLLLTGCPGWSRPDPRLARRAEPSVPSAPAAPTPPRPVTGPAALPGRPVDLTGLRAGLARARDLWASKQGREALAEITAIEDLGNELLVQAKDETHAAEVESLLLDVATLRDEVVRGVFEAR